MKKAVTATIAALLIAVLAGCSQNENRPSSRYNEPTTSSEISKNEVVTEAHTEVPTEGIGEKLERYKPVDSFANGFIWVEYNQNYKGLMSESGKIVYSVDKNAKTGTMSEEGYAFFSEQSNDNKQNKLYANKIIDKEGSEVFTLQDTDDETYKIWAQGDGLFLVSKQESGFSDVKHSIYAINSQGEMVGTKKEVEKQPTSVTFVGNKMFFVSFEQYGTSEFNVLNCNNDTFYLLNGSRAYYPMYNGTGYIFSYIYQKQEPYYQYSKGSITYDDIGSGEAWKKWLSNHSVDNESYSDNMYIKYLQEGYRYFGSKNEKTYFFGYDDKHINLPKFPEKTSVEEFGEFSGGYLPLYLKGADGKHYVTVVDTSGKQMYEPVKITESYWLSGCKHYSSNGKVLTFENKQYNLIDVSGNMEQLSINPAGNPEGYDGDYCYHTAGIWSFKENKEITAYFPIKSSDSTYSSQYGGSTSSAAQKNYIVKNDFSIIGKWKNVGEYTFGQAQKGSIVSFDGINCNFFSPKDTYAFYKNGDNYKLDCTSPLADTVSFTVKIVDDNNIDVFNGTDIVELKKVS